MAVRKSPVNYVQENYSGSSGSYYGTSSLYDTVRNLKHAKDSYIAKIAEFIAGLVLLGIYLVLRKYKKDGDRFLAVYTGKVWMECKIGLAVLVIAGGIVGINNYMDVYYGWDYYEYVSEIFYPMMYTLFGNPILLLVFFWILYILINDYRYNRKSPERHWSGIYRNYFRQEIWSTPFKNK